MILSYLGVLIFVGLTAYDTQKIKQMFLTAPDAGEVTQKYALLDALSLYLDFINLFLYLLRIFDRDLLFMWLKTKLSVPSVVICVLSK